MKDSCAFEGCGQRHLAIQPSQRHHVDVSLQASMTGLPVHDLDLYNGEKVRLFTMYWYN